MRQEWQFIAGCLVSTVLASAGCSQQVKQRRYRAESGIAQKIDVESGEVSMVWTNQKTGERRILKGLITQDTEIFINGVSARVEDVRAGDRVEVTVYPASAEVARWVVTRVVVERDESYMLTRPISLRLEDVPAQ